MRMQHEPVYGPEGHSFRWKPGRAAEYVAYLEQGKVTSLYMPLVGI